MQRFTAESGPTTYMDAELRHAHEFMASQGEITARRMVQGSGEGILNELGLILVVLLQ